MNLFRLFRRAFNTPSKAAEDESFLLDHVLVSPKPADQKDATDAENDSDKESPIAKAARRYGKPFKCGPRDMTREVMLVPGSYVTKEGQPQ